MLLFVGSSKCKNLPASRRDAGGLLAVSLFMFVHICLSYARYVRRRWSHHRQWICYILLLSSGLTLKCGKTESQTRGGSGKLFIKQIGRRPHHAAPLKSALFQFHFFSIFSLCRLTPQRGHEVMVTTPLDVWAESESDTNHITWHRLSHPTITHICSCLSDFTLIYLDHVALCPQSTPGVSCNFFLRHLFHK